MAGPKYYSIFFNYRDLKNSKNTIVLIGEVGSGKTTLFNKLTGLDFETRKNTGSITQDVQIASSEIFDSIIMDFPGFFDTQNVYKTFEVQYRAIMNIPIKTICFVVEKRDRPSLIINTLLIFKDIFENYLDNILVVITKSEDLNKDEQIYYEKEIYKNTEFEKIIFSNNNIDSMTIMKQIEKYQRSMNVLKEVYPKSVNFAKNFKIITDIKLNNVKKEYLKEFKNTLEIFENNFDSSEDKALKRALYFAFRDYKNNLIERFYEEAKKEKVFSDDIIESVLAFSNAIYYKFDQFRDKAEKQMEIILTNYKGEENRFKKCPHCKLVWFKITGCSGKVKCGNRDKIRDKFFGYYKDYKVKYQNNKLEITKCEGSKFDKEEGNEFNGLTEDEIQKNKTLKENGQHLIKPLGCGNWITWSEMEDVTEETNKKLQNIPTYDYDIKYKEILIKEEKNKFKDEKSYFKNFKYE